MWRRSCSCRREETALRVSPYGRFLNTTQKEKLKRLQTVLLEGRLILQASRSSSLKSSLHFVRPTPNVQVSRVDKNVFHSMLKGKQLKMKAETHKNTFHF